MPAPLNATLPPFFTLENGYTVRVIALDPTNGNTVTAVIASNVSLSVDQSDIVAEETQTTGPIFLIPGPAATV